jgi:hypothetical protein
MENRLSNTTLPKIAAIIGEGDDGYPGSMMSRIAAKYQIPIIMTALQPDLHTLDYRMPDAQNTFFLMLGATYKNFWTGD